MIGITVPHDVIYLAFAEVLCDQMGTSGPSCKPVTSGQRDDGNPWLYPLVFAGTMLVLLVAAITMMWATLRPLPQIHPIDMRDHEDAEVAVVLSLARQNSMETALGRMSPSVPFSNTGEHMEAKGDADSADVRRLADA